MSRSTSTKRRHAAKSRRDIQICIESGRKIRFPDRKRATSELNAIRAHKSTGLGRTAPESVYKCPHCNDWHLTKRAPRPKS